MLYQNEGIYRYKGGVNWRAVASLLVVVPINLPGLINAIDKSVDTGNHKFFCMSLLFLFRFYFTQAYPFLARSHFPCSMTSTVPRTKFRTTKQRTELTPRSSILVNFLLLHRNNLSGLIQNLPSPFYIRRSNRRIPRRRPSYRCRP